MDVNLLRGLITVLSLAVFVGIVVWTFSKKRKQRFEEAANLPFADDERAQRGAGPAAPERRKVE